MHICEIDFPEPLLTSQKAGSLAVFAGAGVSIPPPSHYPNFTDLANQVAGGALALEPNEPIDHFLGRLKDRGTQVHRIVGEILTNPESKPNTLHFDLLRLFPSSGALRLVTTNFDPHFSTSAPIVFPDSTPPEIHYAPALPRGDSFTGIVYLHGGVERPFERMVLTDADFGQAYLTEGWARIFLQKLFEKYTVLFIGYSHDDPVMNYLARGLPPASGVPKRFALTAPGKEESWQYRGIVPITYKLAESGNRHAALPAAIAAWSKHVRLGALEQEQRVKDIVDLPPPIDPEDIDYIESALRELSTVRFFTRHARTVEWLKWVEERKFLQRLFDPRARLTDVDCELCLWFVEEFQCQHVGQSLSVLRRQGQHFNPSFWSAIAHRLIRTVPHPPSPEALHRWLAVLLNNRPPGANDDLLEHLSNRLGYPEDSAPALLLFEYLTCPVVRMEDDLWSGIQEVDPQEDVKLAVTTRGGGFWLTHF